MAEEKKKKKSKRSKKDSEREGAERSKFITTI